MSDSQMVPIRWPAELLGAVDDAASKAGENRSEWIRTAALKRLRAESGCRTGHAQQLRLHGSVFCNDCGDVVPAPLVTLPSEGAGARKGLAPRAHVVKRPWVR